jgi:hypothetical protein
MFLIDSEARTAKLPDNWTARFNITTIQQAGEPVAKILELPISSKDGEPSFENYANKQVYIASFLTSQREILSAVQKVTGASGSEKAFVQRKERGGGCMGV